MTLRVLIAEPEGFSPRAVALLRERAEVELRACTRDELAAAFATHDVVWFRLGHRIDAALLAGAGRCRVLATPVTGLDHIDLQACAARGIRVVSLRGEVEFLRTVRATAELTLGLLLALVRRIPAAHAHVLDGGWDRDRFRGRELHGRTAGLVGVGRLGTIVAGLLAALGMEVLGADPRPDFPDGVTRVSLEELLTRSDVVSVHASYGPSTRHLIGARELGLLRPGAVLVNTSRGGVVDEGALLAALVEGRLAGAALDVIDGEPDIGAQHPLVRYAQAHENLILVPHIGGNTLESFEKTEVFLAGRVLEALS
jgi:D-3-phosphoglycerate dehydrogenase / 2-oxoglutarate reductase